MKECINCKTQLEDDELFCHECGTKQEIEEVAAQNEETATPSDKKCIHCGETIEEDSAFCPYCGKKQEVEEVKETELEAEKKPAEEKKAEPKQEDNPAPKENLEPKDAPVQETSEEQSPKYEWEEEPKSKKWIWILLVLLVIGGAGWYLMSDGNSYENIAEAVDSDSIAVIDESEMIGEYIPTSELDFLEYFYKGLETEDFIPQNVTANVLNKLKRDFEYDCPSNDCLATWVFTAYPPGADMDMEEGPIISGTNVEGRYKVDFKYSFYNGNRKGFENRAVYLTVSCVDGKYLISDYELVTPDTEQEKTDDKDDEDAAVKETADDNVTMAGKVSKYGIHMVLTIKGASVTGYYYYDSQGNGNRVSLKGSLMDKHLKLIKFGKGGAETGYFEGEYNGTNYEGKNVNYSRDEALPFYVEVVD